jgi:uncharacterized protein YabE (DUF348 family)
MQTKIEARSGKKLTPYLKFATVLAVLIIFAVIYYRTGQPITLVIDGQAYPLRTHRLTVEAVLLQTGLQLRPEDTLWPPLESGLVPGQSIEITLARPMIVDLSTALKAGLNGAGDRSTVFTHRRTPAEIYQELQIDLSAADDIYVDGQLWGHNTPLPVPLTPLSKNRPGFGFTPQLESLRPQSLRIALHKAIPVHIIDDGQETSILTTRQSVGDVLLAQDIPLYLGDLITPDLSTPLAAGATITIERAIPLSIQVDGRTLKTRTRSATVAEALAQEKVALVGQDYTLPAENAAITPNVKIKVVRVAEALEIDKETTDFETLWISRDDLELDTQQIEQQGQEGVTKTRTRVVYENGEEISRVEEETWLEQEPADKIIAYGTKVVIHTLDTPDGPIEYWRKIRMLATSYSAATSGKSRDHPEYGITRTGMQAGYGIVAVDPGVIDLRSEVYVPNYGRAIAGDTGGAILGKHIDLGFEDDEPLPLWYKWVDVYLLTPAPPWHEIRYVLPQWPQE